MWTLIKGLLLKWAMLKWLLKSLGSLGILVPIAFVLKLVGLPVLIVLAVLALPILLMLMLFGMPFILVFLFGGALLAILSAVLSFGLNCSTTCNSFIMSYCHWILPVAVSAQITSAAGVT